MEPLAILAKQLSALGDERRLAMYMLVQRRGEVRRAELQRVRGVCPEAAFVHHLKVLVDAGLIQKSPNTVEGATYYMLTHDSGGYLLAVLTTIVKGDQT